MEDNISPCQDFLLDVFDNISLSNETQKIKDTIVEVMSIEVVVDNVDAKVEATWRMWFSTLFSFNTSGCHTIKTPLYEFFFQLNNEKVRGVVDPKVP